MNKKYIIEDGLRIEVRKLTKEDKVKPTSDDATIVDWDNYFKTRS